MDIIEDVESALIAYLENEFPTSKGEQYLRIYGAMQALFIQQDALDNLIRAIHPATSIKVKDDLKVVREARNASVGHPTELRRKGVLSAHSIVQATMRKDGFELLSYPPKDGKALDYVRLRELIETQRVEAVRILTEVVSDLSQKDEEHRAAFREEKLRNAFDQVLYAFEKIFEEAREHSPVALSRWGIDHLQASLDTFERLLEERGLSTDSYDSIKYLYQEIRHPLTELRKFFNNEASEVRSHEGAIGFANALKSSFTQLMENAVAIDQDYAAKSNTP
jgi:Zn-dependent M32 family carboxypeptidase